MTTGGTKSGLRQKGVLYEGIPPNQVNNRTSSESMEIMVKRLDQEIYSITIQPGDTVLQMKQLLYEKGGIPPSRQWMISEGRTLQDDEIAGELLGRSGTIVSLMIKTRNRCY